MEIIEKQEIADRTKALDEEEQQIVVKLLPSDLLWEELRRRDATNREMITNARNALKILG